MSEKIPVLYPDHAMYTDAVNALKRYHEAQAAGLPTAEVERLRQTAESQFAAVTEYQLKALRGHAGNVH
ncbi:hypothetical protein [Pseudomonas sp. zjy_14]|uniref:hypothetical protein n=1 Tax=Pseudomonas sp. zjy_14 TaxID=3367264 RepID=UPI00370A691A